MRRVDIRDPAEHLSAQPAKPDNLPHKLANVPAEMVSRDSWCLWNFEFNAKTDNWTKPPRQTLHPGRHADASDPEAWSTFEASRKALEAGKADGIGFNLLDSGIGALDLDHCRDVNGQADTWAQIILDQAERLGAYIEVTPSGAGYRVLGRATGGRAYRIFKIAGGRKDAALEIWRAAAKYTTVTGARESAPHTSVKLANIDKLIDDLIADHDAAPKPAPKKNGAAYARHSGEQIDYDAIIRDGEPVGENRSDCFNKCVWHLRGIGMSRDDIIAELAEHPDGVSRRYIAENRLAGEVDRCLKDYPDESGQEAAESRKGRDRFKIIRINQIVLDADPLWLAEDILPAGPSLTVVYGPPKQLKSFLLTHIFMHVAAGIDYASCKVRQGPVVYITSEGVRGVKRRLVAMHRELGLEGKDTPFHFISEVPDFGAGKGDCEVLIRRLESDLTDAPVAIGIDTLRRAIPGKSESDQKDMGRFIDNCGQLADHFKANISVVHHSPRADDSRTSGSNSLDAAADVMIACLRRGIGDMQATATLTHVKDGEKEGESWDFEIVPSNVGTEEKLLRTCFVRVVTPLGEGVRKTRTGRPLSPEQQRIFDVLLAAVVAGPQARDASIPLGVRAISKETFWQACKAHGEWDSSDKKSDTRSRNRINHHLTKLAGTLRIGMAYDFIWINRREGE